MQRSERHRPNFSLNLAATLLGVVAAMASVAHAQTILQFNAVDRPLDLALSPTGSFAVVRGEREVLFADLQTGVEIARFPTAVMQNVGWNGASDLVGVSSSGDRVVALGGVNIDSVLIFDTSGATPVLLTRTALPNLPHDLALAPDGRFVAVGTDLRGSIDRAWFFDLTTGVLQTQFSAATGLFGRYTADSVVVSPDSTRVIVSGGAGTSSLMFFDTSGLPTVLNIVGTATPPHDVEIAPNQVFVVARTAASPDGSAFLDLDGGWLANFGSSLAPPTACSDYVAVSSDSRHAVTIGMGGFAGGDTVRLFDTSSVPTLRFTDSWTVPGQDVAVSANNQFAVVAGGNWAGNRTAFYDLNQGSRTAMFPFGGGGRLFGGNPWGWWWWAWGWQAAPPAPRDVVEIAPDSGSAVVLQLGSWWSPAGLISVYDCTQPTPSLVNNYSISNNGPHDLAITPDSTIAVVHADGDFFFSLPLGTFLGRTTSSNDFDACDNIEISGTPRRIVTLNLSGASIYAY